MKLFRPILTGIAGVVLAALAGADRIYDQVSSYQKSSSIPAVNYLVTENGRVTHQGALGKIDLERNVNSTLDSVFEIGSVTKQFTSAGLLILVQEGKLSLEDPIGKHLPNLPELWKPITVRQCLSHTAGLKDFLANFGPNRVGFVSSNEIYKKMGKVPLDFAPGTSWSYSNLGYYLSGDLIEKLSGKSIAEFYKERLFTPLGMTHSGVSNPDDLIKLRAAGYVRGPKGPKNSLPINPSTAKGAGEIVSTVGDLAKWANAILNHKLLTRESTEELWKAITLKDGSRTDYGLGWMFAQDKGRRVIYHGGNTYGFSASITLVPDAKKAIIILTNVAGENPGTPARMLLSILDPSFDLTKRTKEKDPNIQGTAMFARMLRNFSRRSYATPILAPSFAGRLNSLRGQGYRGSFVRLGGLMKSFEHLDSEPVEGGRLGRYILKIDGADLFLTLRWSKDELIENFDSLYAVPANANRSARKK